MLCRHKARPFFPGCADSKVFISVTAFSGHICDALMQLPDCAALSVAGELQATAYINREGQPLPALSTVANSVHALADA